MNWLTPNKVLPLAGYPAPENGAEYPSEQLDALKFAQALIEQRTNLIWGRHVRETLRITLSARSFVLPLPFDVRLVKGITPQIPHNALWERTRYGLELFDATYDQIAWLARTYRVDVHRGITKVPHDVRRAGALLAAHFLTLADPERSRYESLGLGDFTGTERRDAFPVPAAETLLRPWIRGVKVGVA